MSTGTKGQASRLGLTQGEGSELTRAHSCSRCTVSQKQRQHGCGIWGKISLSLWWPLCWLLCDLGGLNQSESSEYSPITCQCSHPDSLHYITQLKTRLLQQGQPQQHQGDCNEFASLSGKSHICKTKRTSLLIQSAHGGHSLMLQGATHLSLTSPTNIC